MTRTGCKKKLVVSGHASDGVEVNAIEAAGLHLHPRLPIFTRKQSRRGPLHRLNRKQPFAGNGYRTQAASNEAVVDRLKSITVVVASPQPVIFKRQHHASALFGIEAQRIYLLAIYLVPSGAPIG